MHRHVRKNRYTLIIILIAVVSLMHITACTNTAGIEYIADKTGNKAGGKAEKAVGHNTEDAVSDSEADTSADNAADATGDNTAPQSGFPLSDIEGCNGAVFSSGDRLYVYDAKNGSVREIDGASGPVHFIGLSPDKTVAAYLCSFRTENRYSTAAKIGLYEIAAGKATELVLDDNLSQLMNVRWTSDKTIMVEGHLNPSANVYQAFDAREGRSLFVRPVGRLFDVSSDGSRIIYYFSPHFSEMLPPHLRISGVNTDDPDAAVGIDGPVYEVGHADDCIRQACFAGECRLLFIEFKAEDMSHWLKFADIKENMIEIVSEMRFNIADLDMDNIIAMEYFEDRSGLYIISRDAGNSGDPAESGINLHEFLLKDPEIVSVNVVPTGLDISLAHEIDIAVHGSDIIITDITGSGDRVYRKTYKYDGKGFYQVPANQAVSHGTLRSLEEYAGKLTGAAAGMKIDEIELY